MAAKLAMIFFSMILVNNYVLVQFLGICPFLGVSKKLDSAFGMSCAVVFVMALATAATWPIYTFILAANGLEYLQTIVFILVIAVLVQLVEIILKKYMPPLYKALGVYLPLITTNCAVLGVTMLVPEARESATVICGCISVGKPGYGRVLTLTRDSGPRRVTRTASSCSSISTPISLSLAVMQSRCLGMMFLMSRLPPAAATAAR